MSFLDDLKRDVTDTLKGDLRDLELIRESGTYNIASGTTNTTEIVYSGTGFSQSVSDKYIDKSTADLSDREIVILQSTLTDSQGSEIEPEASDDVKIDGERYSVVQVNEGPSATLWTVVGTQ